MKILAVAFFVFLLTGIAPAQAAKKYTDKEIETIIHEKMDKAWSTHRFDGVNQVVKATGMDTFIEQQSIALWAQKKYELKYDRNARVGLLLADSLGGMAKAYAKGRREEEANKALASGALAFFSSQLIAYEDIARCADNSAGKAYAALWQKGGSYEQYKKFLAGLPEAERKKLWSESLQIASERNVGRPDKQICATGTDAIAKSQMDKQCMADPENCDPVQFVELIKDDVWQTRREQVRTLIGGRVEKGQI